MRTACRVILGLWLLLCAGTALAQKSHSSSHSSHSSHSSGSHSIYVHGYTRKDGTYVSPHYRSAPGTASPSTGAGYGPIDVSGTGHSDLSEWAATHRVKSAPHTTTERPSASTSAGTGHSITWSRPSAVPKPGTYPPRSKGISSGNASHGGTHYGTGTTRPKTNPSHTTTAGGTTGHHSKTYCSTCPRNSHQKIARSERAKEDFMRRTGHPHGWSGHVVDHIKPLACGGRDEPSNMQWQTIEAARLKDKTERKGCS